MVNLLFLYGILIGAVIFIIYCPILKPWFGLRKPTGHKGKWFE
jgi:hypothetical protein